MGCWNHTCAITNLPIYAGDEVEVIMLQFSAQVAGSSLCYPYFYHVPLPLTFQGRYDDYGGVEDCSGVCADIVVEAIKEHLFEMEEGENEYHEPPVKKDDFDIKNMFRLDHDDRVNIVNPYRGYPDEKEKTMIKHIVVRKEVYDKLVESMQISWWDPETQKTVDVDFDFIMQHRYGIAKDIDEILATDVDDFKRFSWRMHDSIGNDSLAGQMLARNGEYRGSSVPINIMELLVDLREHKDIRYEDVLQNALRFAMIRHFMVDARKVWVLPSGMGSQNDNTHSQRLCAELTLASAEIVDHKWDEEE